MHISKLYSPSSHALFLLGQVSSIAQPFVTLCGNDNESNFKKVLWLVLEIQPSVVTESETTGGYRIKIMLPGEE